MQWERLVKATHTFYSMPYSHVSWLLLLTVGWLLSGLLHSHTSGASSRLCVSRDYSRKSQTSEVKPKLVVIILHEIEIKPIQHPIPRVKPSNTSNLFWSRLCMVTTSKDHLKLEHNLRVNVLNYMKLIVILLFLLFFSLIIFNFTWLPTGSGMVGRLIIMKKRESLLHDFDVIRGWPVPCF